MASSIGVARLLPSLLFGVAPHDAVILTMDYWSEAKRILRIASGDVLDVDTLLTSTPERLETAGVPPADVQSSLRAIVEQVKDRGPGGHILTGSVLT